MEKPEYILLCHSNYQNCSARIRIFGSVMSPREIFHHYLTSKHLSTLWENQPRSAPPVYATARPRNINRRKKETRTVIFL